MNVSQPTGSKFILDIQEADQQMGTDMMPENLVCSVERGRGVLTSSSGLVS